MMSRQHGGSYYVDEAKKHGLKVKPGKGDHIKITGMLPDGRRTMMPIPMHRELANGTECAIKKWFKALGIFLVLVVLVLHLIGA